MILQLVLLFQLQSLTNASQEEDLVHSDGSWCHALLPEAPHPDLINVQEPKRKYFSTNPTKFAPYRMLFVYDQDTSTATRILLKKAADAANDRFSRIVKGPVLTDIRLPRQWNSKFLNLISMYVLYIHIYIFIYCYIQYI